MDRTETFLIPFDFSPHAEAALATGAALARKLGATLHLLHVIQPPSLMYGYSSVGGLPAPPIDIEDLRKAAEEALERVLAGVPDLPGAPRAHAVEAPNIADAIRATAQDVSADLIVMGTHGRTGLAHAFLGSVAERTLRRAPCPVLTVRGEESDVD